MWSHCVVLVCLCVYAPAVTGFNAQMRSSFGARMALDMVASKDVLIIGDSRFSGAYLWKELYDRGHKVTIFNQGKTVLKPLRGESDNDFEARKAAAKFIAGDRKDAVDMTSKLSGESFNVVYDMTGRTVEDTAPVADLFNGKVEHFVYMSSAGIYKKTGIMPHREGDEVDERSRHKGKLETETYLAKIGIPWTSIRPTYIYGPGNYIPLEEYFFSRLDAGRRICIPGHGQHITGLGHVQDLAVAMANVIGRPQAVGKAYNVQDSQSITLEGLATLCAEAMDAGSDGKGKGTVTDLKYYDCGDFDFGCVNPFPLREQHFFCSVDQAKIDLDWEPEFSLLKGLTDSFEHDFSVKKAAGALVFDFTTDDMVLDDDRVKVRMYDGMPEDQM